MEFTFNFIEVFFYVVMAALPLLGTLALLVASLGLIVARIESWTAFVGIYWAFITATTVGYGDIRAQHKRSRVISVMIAFTGIVFTGIFVAIAVESASFAFQLSDQPPTIRKQFEALEAKRAALQGDQGKPE